MQFMAVSQGITNINAKITPKPELGLAPVMFKVFGDKTEHLIDRAAEKVVVVALGKNRFGPKVLALFGNGRIEEWLNCAGITPADMCDPEFVPRIARLLRRFHGLDIALPRQPYAPWGVIEAWLQKAKSLQFEDAVKLAAYQQINFSQIEDEIRETQAVCALTNSPIIFGHNDLLSGNILILQQPGFDPRHPDLKGPLCFIDYEYGSYTYRGFDIGNHFTEYAGFEGDYTRYPTKEQQGLFFRHYLADPSSDSTQTAQLTPEQLDQLSAEANVWALASHIFWGVWAIIQARYSPIDFDYMLFHNTRFGEFRRRKEEFLAEARRVFG
eukprot:gene8598-8780_t